MDVGAYAFYMGSLLRLSLLLDVSGDLGLRGFLHGQFCVYSYMLDVGDLRYTFYMGSFAFTLIC